MTTFPFLSALQCCFTAVLLLWKKGLSRKFTHVLHCHIELAFFLTVYVFGSCLDIVMFFANRLCVQICLTACLWEEKQGGWVGGVGWRGKSCPPFTATKQQVYDDKRKCCTYPVAVCWITGVSGRIFRISKPTNRQRDKNVPNKPTDKPTETQECFEQTNRPTDREAKNQEDKKNARPK